ncbi:MAG: tRNA (uridine(34)/cytosine(34)/5-carboxymethylaminomethyluridine(34)-2'-O)-methyltransferase TrmL [Cellvibrionaceae bacterium]|nr:tRNA (uridine(34)/cytosine(34)/5-carboxymethylaminomethyluridine(34)-2'-O)-methyltransferase TrmL [Cellvibrionaceae bacterium]
MLNIVLLEPEIPPNTGNIIRLAANSGCRVHLIEPLGFTLDDKRLRRAGLDYDEWCDLKTYPNWSCFLANKTPGRLFAISTKGKCHHHRIAFDHSDFLLFGPETRGLPDRVVEDAAIDTIVRIPMQAHSRSMNLANAVSVVVYEAWRQQDFCGAV